MRFVAAGLWLLWSALAFAQTPEALFDDAVRALNSGEYAAAERGFQAVLKTQPGNVPALSNLGIVYSRSGRPDRAITAYQRALRISPNEKAILLNLGLVYLKQEAHAKALPLFARVVTLDPHHLQARQLLAVCRVYTGELRPAIQELESLRAASPKDETILFLLGFAYLKNHETERAQMTFQLMFDAAGPVRGQFLIGKANYEATLFPQAEENFREVLKLDPAFPGAHLELGKVYISLRKTDDAIRELQTVLKQNPGDGDASYFLGGLLVQDGRFAEGIPYLERAKAVNPESWATYFYLGKAKLRLNLPAEAVGLLQRAVALNPDEASAYYQLGQALESTGHHAEAQVALRKVRDLKAAALEATKLDGNVAGAR